MRLHRATSSLGGRSFVRRHSDGERRLLKKWTGVDVAGNDLPAKSCLTWREFESLGEPTEAILFLNQWSPGVVCLGGLTECHGATPALAAGRQLRQGGQVARQKRCAERRIFHGEIGHSEEKHKAKYFPRAGHQKPALVALRRKSRFDTRVK